ncbi:lytic transglycosylase domain-containing protein [Acidobacteriota bacterium]
MRRLHLFPQTTLLSLMIFSLFISPSLDLRAEPKDKLYNKTIKAMSAKHNVPAQLIHSIIRAESNYNSAAVSSKGAVGLMQLMPDTAKHYGVQNLLDPKENIEGGVKFLKDLIKAYNEKTDLVLAAYNAGQEAIKKYGGIPPYPETQKYIKNVKASYGKPLIRSRTIIYKFYDKSGKLILTNIPHLYAQAKKGKKTK